MMITKRYLLIGMVIALTICISQVGLAQSPTVSFPLGLMGPSINNEPPELGTVPQKLVDVAAGGFNVVYEFRAVQDISQAEQYLDQAEDAGLKVIQNLPLCRAYESDHPICQQFSISVWNESKWARFIQRTAAHDNLVAWYLPDEIDNYEAAANLYEWVYEYDHLDRPVYANPGSFEQSDIDQFPAFTDFLWAVSYPELEEEPRAQTTHMMTLDANAAQGTDTKWGAILQFFDSSQFPEFGTVGHPTARELRSDSYQAIIGGAKGLWYFNYEMGKADELDELWDEMVIIADEIIGSGRLDEVILSPDVPQGIVKRIISGPMQSPPTHGRLYPSIQTLQKWHEGDGTYLFAVNIAEDTVVVEFENLWAETDSVEVLFEGRTVPIVDDSFSDTFAQDDVHIYYYPASQPAAPLSGLTISVTDSPDPVTIGNALTYQITVKNNGPSPATNVTLTNTLPTNVIFGSTTPSQGSCNGTGPVICNLGTLASDATATINIIVNPTELGMLSSLISVTSDVTDPDLDDNTTTENTLVSVQVYLPIVLKN